MGFVTLSIILLLVVLALRWGARRRSNHSHVAHKAEAQQREQRSREILTQHLSPIAVPFALAKGETAYWAQPVTLQALHPNVQYQGESSGVSIRLARGIYAHSGSSSGRRVVTNAWGKDDIGSAYITNQRFVFVGALSSLEAKRTKIMGVDRYLDAVVLKRSNAKAICLLTRDPEALSAILSRMLKDTLSKGLQDVVDALRPSAEQKPAAVGLNMELNGPNEQIRSALVEFYENLSQTVKSREASLNALASTQVAPPATNEITPSTSLNKFFDSYRDAVDALAASTNSQEGSPKERLGGFVAAVGAFLDSLQNINREIKTASFPAGYENTRRALTTTCERNVDTVKSWPSIIQHSIENVGASTSYKIDLSFVVDIDSIMNSLHDDAQRSLIA